MDDVIKLIMKKTTEIMDVIDKHKIEMSLDFRYLINKLDGE